MKKVEFIVVIVNYNSYKDCKKAIESICKYTETDEYAICIYDNFSDDKLRIQKLSQINSHVVVIKGSENAGYAKGNNNAIKYMQSIYDFKYIFIMNPDVEFIEYKTCENLIKKIEQKKDNYLVGGQPLSWTYAYGNNPKLQTNIRKVDNLFDIFVLSLCINRLIFKKTWDKINYIKQRPYNEEIQYLIPNGSFFFIRADIFNEIGMFDEDTFLYNEELILGKKLSFIDKKLLFMPQFMVKHAHSGSIGAKKYSVSWKTYRYEIQSKKVLVQKYYNSNIIYTYVIQIISIADFILKKIAGTFLKLMREIRK